VLLQVLIVGSGAFGQGLASLAHRTGATAAYAISIGSRKLQPGNCSVLPGLEDTPVRSLDEALPQADVVSMR
jgi:predicted dinucleotide-binding enzyme